MRCRLIAALLIAGSASWAQEADRFRAAAAYSTAHKGTALLVVRSGEVVFEQYAKSSRAKEMKIYSGTKAFWCLAALAAQEEGILSLDERVSAILPEWAADERKARITLRQLLDFSGGLEATTALHGDGWRDRNEHALKQELVAHPGRAFIYGPAALQVFHEVLKRKLQPAGQTPTTYLERRVLRPLGLGRQRYLPDKTGNPLLATGFSMTAKEWAKFGRLVLANGAPVLQRGMGEMRRGSAVNPMFAFGLWNNRLASNPGAREVDPEEMLDLKWHRQNWQNACLCRSAPRDLLAAIGSGGQRLYIVPSRELVVVRQGWISNFSDRAFLQLLFGRSDA